MANPKNVIALNGKIYDVATGSLVNNLLSKKAKAEKPKPLAANKVNSNIDGFSSPLSHPRPAKALKPHQPAKHHARKPQHAKTLVRSAVKHARHDLKASGRTETGGRQDLGPKENQQRKERSETITRSSLVSRFGQHTGIVKKVEPLEVKKPTGSGKHVKTAADSKSHALPASQSSDIFARAIEQADSHNQAPVKIAKRRHISKRLRSASRTTKLMTSLLVTVLLLGGVVWYFLPSIQVKIASVRSGVSASLPAYHPSGFSQSAIDYKEGVVTVAYKSNSDNRSFSIQQSASKWDSETLLRTYLEPAQKPYQTYQDQGKTIYIYNGSDATWVSGGVWYKIESNSNLNSDQLLRIANSL